MKLIIAGKDLFSVQRNYQQRHVAAYPREFEVLLCSTQFKHVVITVQAGQIHATEIFLAHTFLFVQYFHQAI